MYTEETWMEARKRARREGAISIGLLAIGVALAVTALVIRNRYLGMAGLALFAVMAYARYALCAAPWYRYAQFMAEVLGGLTREHDEVFLSIGDEVRTTEDGVRVRDVTMAEDNAQYYWDAQYPFADIASGDRVRVKAYGRYIREIVRSTKNAVIN